jgi:hypothetical protein
VTASSALVALLVLPAALGAQQTEIRRSQHGTVTQRVGLTEIAISYNRPLARGRQLFGDLVPWGRVWHPGADSATTISFSRDVTVQGRDLAAGRYTLWTIPAEPPAQWTVVFNSSLGGWHTPYPGESYDVLRVLVTPEQGAHMETLAYYFPVVAPDSAVLRLHWGTTIVPLVIRPK